MKRVFTILFILVLCYSMMNIVAYADGFDFSKMSDKELTELFDSIRTEMLERGLTVPDSMTLRDGKYIVGEDILPGTYKIVCISTEGETLGGLYSSLGQAYSSFGEDEGWGNLMGSLGGMIEDLTPTVVEIIGDYDTVLKSFEMKKGDEISISLTEKTALQISDGCCILETSKP